MQPSTPPWRGYWLGDSIHRDRTSGREIKAEASRECGRLPLPKGEGWGEGLQTSDRSEPPHPNPLPVGEREFRRAVMRVRAQQEESARATERPSQPLAQKP